MVWYEPRMDGREIVCTFPQGQLKQRSKTKRKIKISATMITQGESSNQDYVYKFVFGAGFLIHRNVE